MGKRPEEVITTVPAADLSGPGRPIQSHTFGSVSGRIENEGAYVPMGEVGRNGIDASKTDTDSLNLAVFLVKRKQPSDGIRLDQ